MARRKIETPTVPGSIVIDLASGKTLEKALPAVICSRIKFFRVMRDRGFIKQPLILLHSLYPIQST